MKINKENIESFIFDYHEGNLSDSDKAEVLNFIHQHPEYENDFTHWAQSYFHAEDPIKNYGITDKLLQKDVIQWYTNKWLAISGGVVIFAIGLYSYLLLNTKTQKPSASDAPPIIATKQIELGKTETPVSIFKTEDADSNTMLITLKNDLPSETSVLKENTAKPVGDTLVKTDTDYTPPISTPTQKDAVSKTDTIDKNIPLQESNEVKTKKPATKHKSGLNLKPENKFIPTNPDF